MKALTLVPVGAIPPGVMDSLSGFLSDAIKLQCLVSKLLVNPTRAYDTSRGQYDSRLLLPPLEELAGQEGTWVLGVSDVDIFSSVFTFIFGEAQLGGKAGIFSLHRLRPTFYGLGEDPELLMSRARREALHEVGHLLGLLHCKNANCIMVFSPSAEEVDLKSEEFCATCWVAVKDALWRT